MEHIMYYVVIILLIWLLCLFSVLLHEVGHTLGYRSSTGKARWKIIAGSGPKMIDASKYIFRLIPASGYFIPGEEPKTNTAKIITLAGGPSVSLLQTILYGVIRFCILEFVQSGIGLHETLLSVSTFLLYFNFFQFFFTVILIRYRIICRGLESDGLQIIHLLKHNKAQ